MKCISLLLLLALLPSIALAEVRVVTRIATLDSVLEAAGEELEQADILTAWAYLILALRIDPDSGEAREALSVIQSAAGSSAVFDNSD